MVLKTAPIVGLLLFLILKSYSLDNNDGDILFSNRDTIINEVLKENIRDNAINKQPISKLGRVHSNYIHEVYFIVKQRNIDELEKQLHSVSDPSSPSYLKFWKADEVANLCGNKKGRDHLMNYLFANGVIDVSETPNGEIVTARSSINVWENMFHTEFYHFEHNNIDEDDYNGKSRKSFIRAETYRIPLELDSVVASVLGTTQVPFYNKPISPQKIDLLEKKDNDIIKSRKLQSTVIPLVSPNKLRNFYNVSTRLTGSVKATQSIFSTLTDSMSPSDLKFFQEFFAPSFVQPVSLALNTVLNDTYCRVNLNNCGM